MTRLDGDDEKEPPAGEALDVSDPSASAAVHQPGSTSAPDEQGAEPSAANEQGAAEPSTAAGMIKAMSKLSVGTNVLGETRATYSNADGKHLKGDVMHPAADMSGAMVVLKKMAEDARAKAKEKKKVIWDFRSSPHTYLNKTLDDTFTSFLNWARVAEDDDGAAPNGTLDHINVSKAFRRLEAYAEWMEEAADDLTSSPLVGSSVAAALKAWCMSTSIDKNGRVVWWIDLAKLDLKAVKKLTPEDSLRAFVFFAHAVMYDERAQRHGMAFCENMAQLGFWASMTLMPIKLSVKLDRLTIGIIPVKMKALLLLDCPAWMNVLMKIFGVFVSKKMKSRMTFLKKDWAAPAHHFGAEAVPRGFGGCEGATLTTDPILDQYA